jgi:hypothetical protein
MEIEATMIDDGANGPWGWPAKLRCDLVLAILRDEITVEGAAERHQLETDEIRDWIARFLAGAAAALAPARDDRDRDAGWGAAEERSHHLVDGLRRDLGKLRTTTVGRASLAAWDD